MLRVDSPFTLADIKEQNICFVALRATRCCDKTSRISARLLRREKSARQLCGQLNRIINQIKRRLRLHLLKHSLVRMMPVSVSLAWRLTAFKNQSIPPKLECSSACKHVRLMETEVLNIKKDNQCATLPGCLLVAS